MNDIYMLVAIVVGLPAAAWLVYRIFLWPIQVEKRIRELEDHVI